VRIRENLRLKIDRIFREQFICKENKPMRFSRHQIIGSLIVLTAILLLAALRLFP
jgi:hypothetical protein